MSLDHPLNRPGRRPAGRPGRPVRRAAGGRARTTAPTRRRARWRRLTAVRAHRGRILLAIVAGLVVLAVGWFLLRDASFVRVTKVQVSGITSSAEPRIDAALDSAARSMTTLHVREDVLRRAVMGFPSVAGLDVTTHFPHGMTIHVDERRPVAALVAGGSRLAVSADGRLLRDVQDTIGLPAIVAGALPAGARVRGARIDGALTVAAAAPDDLRRHSQRIFYGPHGLTVQLVDGPPLYFGDGSQAAAKWTAAARVLADQSSAGATYLDLREPGRVSAGGLGPITSEDADGDAAPTAPADTAATTATTP